MVLAPGGLKGEGEGRGGVGWGGEGGVERAHRQMVMR